MVLTNKLNIFITAVFEGFFFFNYSDQAEARRSRNKAAKLRREERLEQKRKEVLKAVAKEEEQTAK